MKLTRMIVYLCLPLHLAACAVVPMPPASQADAVPEQWLAPLPHNGTLVELSAWWAQHGDPVLVSLIVSAQAASPSIAAALTRIAQAQATLTNAQAALLPRLDASASATHSSAQPPVIPVNTSLSADLRASWELDLSGGNRATRAAAEARDAGAHAAWHDARVTVAADVANLYYSLRACNKLLAITRFDAVSRAETARLSALAADAGFTAPATLALARATAAEGNQRVTQQQAQCDLDIKALVALAAVAESELRQKLKEMPATLTRELSVALASVPAQMLAQRPDVYAAEREQVAASFEVGGAEALRYPRLTVSGAVGVARFSAGGVSTDLSTWSVGPLALSVPLFDGGRSAANLHLARVRYAETSSRYRASVRDAVREVEQALVNLASTDRQRTDAAAALDGYRAAYDGVEHRYREGLASLLELEDARRTRLVAETALVNLQQQRMMAWIALYRAVGGGWTPQSPGVQTATAANQKTDR